MPKTGEEGADKRMVDRDEEPVDRDEDEEEVEYEEVEVEVEEEIEEEEDEEEEDEEEEEEEVEEEDEEEKGNSGNTTEVSEEEQKRYELLALPPNGSDVYLGGIPNNASEDDLRAFCGSVGEVTEVRMMKNKDSSDGKCYAFVTFRNKDLASKAIEELNNSELKGKKIKCSTSQTKYRLSIRNVPRSWGDEDMKKALTDVGPGVVSVELPKDMKDPTKNRGSASIVYYNHACADYSKKKMSDPKFKLDNKAPDVSWFESKNAESSSSSQVKAIYIKNLPKDITQDRLIKTFERHGEITKVVVPPAKPGHENSRYGFVHFQERSSAIKALENNEKYEIDGKVLECSFAKPQTEQKSFGGQSTQKSTLLPNLTYPPHLGYGMVPGFGALGAGYNGGYAQPMMYGSGPSPSGMAMMPMLLPDGRIGYVLQQPGFQPQPRPMHPRGGRSGPRGSHRGGRGSNRHHPY